MRVVGSLLFAAAVTTFGVVTVGGSGGAASGDDGPPVLGPGTVTVRLVVQDSRFTPSRIHVVPHTEVRFEVVNRDFLNHEFIIGGDEVHARHQQGHEAWHPPVPGEVSIPPHETGVTTYAFHAPGKVLFACHLPGHFAFGMTGSVIVGASPSTEPASPVGAIRP
ncbi:MAG: multicopper oxidase domain-containing protein [Acidimicrobiia bacterium]